jgi:AraC-like DNA-binding protein
MLEDVERFLETNYQDVMLSAYVVSKELGISEKYLFQFWREQTGGTFGSYMLQIRLEKAKEYLINTDYSNKQITEMIGFTTVNTFYRNFKKKFGVTPKIYREYYKDMKEEI